MLPKNLVFLVRAPQSQLVNIGAKNAFSLNLGCSEIVPKWKLLVRARGQIPEGKERYPKPRCHRVGATSSRTVHKPFQNAPCTYYCVP